jgi:hypothetical protein
VPELPLHVRLPGWPAAVRAESVCARPCGTVPPPARSLTCRLAPAPLPRHIQMVHLSERPHVCATCGKAFKQKAHMEKVRTPAARGALQSRAARPRSTSAIRTLHSFGALLLPYRAPRPRSTRRRSTKSCDRACAMCAALRSGKTTTSAHTSGPSTRWTCSA